MSDPILPDDVSDSPAAFAQFDLDPRLLQTVAELGFEVPTPIQASAIGPLLEGRDVVGRARTGSGKTAAFGLPLLHHVRDGGPGGVKALVLAPTRELALQVTEALRSYAKGLAVRMVTVYGGAPYGPQVNALRRGVEVVVGTPGRLIDLQTRKFMDLSSVQLVVIDEADEMLRMGFIEDVERLLADTPDSRQVALFSATMPPPIRKVAEAYLKDPVEIQVELSVLSVGHIEQHWMGVPYYHKPEGLQRVLRASPGATALVFARTRAECAEVAEGLNQRGFSVEPLHGDLSQPARERVMRRFRSQQISVVVATDVAARGLDVEHITHVINYDLPDNIESYVHRIGRTGRAGRKGLAISFVTPREVRRVSLWERALKVKIAEMTVPSDAEIAVHQLGGLKAELGAVLEGAEAAEATAARAGLARVLEASDWSAEDVAAAALAIIAKARGVSLADQHSDRPPRWARPQRPLRREYGDRARPDRYPQNSRNARGPDRQPRTPGGERKPPDFAAANEVELFLATGQQNGVRVADIVGLLANEKAIPSRRIGRITILDRKSFVGLPREVAETLLRDGSTLCIRGVDVHIDLARPKDQGGVGPRAEAPRGDAPRRNAPRAAPPREKPAKPIAPKKPFNAERPAKPVKAAQPAAGAKPAPRAKPAPGSKKPMWAKFAKHSRHGNSPPRRSGGKFARKTSRK